MNESGFSFLGISRSLSRQEREKGKIDKQKRKQEKELRQEDEREGERHPAGQPSPPDLATDEHPTDQPDLENINNELPSSSFLLSHQPAQHHGRSVRFVSFAFPPTTSTSKKPRQLITDNKA